MDRVQVVLEIGLDASGVPHDVVRYVLAELADAVMEALLAMDAEDPFVYGDASAPKLMVEVVVQADTTTSAVAAAAKVIDEAFQMVEGRESMRATSTSSRADVLVPA
jgi:hypothetical protein